MGTIEAYFSVASSCLQFGEVFLLDKVSPKFKEPRMHYYLTHSCAATRDELMSFPTDCRKVNATGLSVI